MRLIDADELADNIAVLFERNQALIDEWLMNQVEDAIDEAPTIDAEPIRHGKWIADAEDWRHQIEWFKCSLCGFPTSTAYKYCPSCGARMDEEEL